MYKHCKWWTWWIIDIRAVASSFRINLKGCNSRLSAWAIRKFLLLELFLLNQKFEKSLVSKLPERWPQTSNPFNFRMFFCLSNILETFWNVGRCHSSWCEQSSEWKFDEFRIFASLLGFAAFLASSSKQQEKRRNLKSTHLFASSLALLLSTNYEWSPTKCSH